MKPAKQTKLHISDKQNGNCMNAAFASILELDIEDIPHFEDMPECGQGTKENPSWWKALNDWLWQMGFYLETRNGSQGMPPVYFIANGPSPRGLEHSVIYKGTEMVHDPHPSNEGLNEVTSIWILVPIDPSFMMKRNN